jgi:hypothetical protein
LFAEVSVKPRTTILIAAVFLFVFALFVLAVATSAAQAVNTAPPVSAAPEPDPQFGPRRNQVDESVIRMERERAKRVNHERHVALKKDTDKLLGLANELKQYVDRSNENTLSLEVMKKAEEIEKLAKSVKEKMKGE